MRTDEEWIDLYESLHKNDMMWFALASMISAENFYLLDKEKKISVYEQNIRYLTQIATLLPKSNIDIKERKKMVKYAKRGVKILQKEYNELIEKQ
jgi:hypothetical protein